MILDECRDMNERLFFLKIEGIDLVPNGLRKVNLSNGLLMQPEQRRFLHSGK
jgi:hypothetical protein